MKVLLRKMYGGGLRPSDPRRYLVEAMVGAMHADGEIDPKEEEALQRNLEEHDLFAGLGPELAADLIRMRSQRLTAYAVAAEVCLADQNVAPREMAFLEALRDALELTEYEARELFEAGRTRSGMMLLEDKTRRMREVMPLFVRVMAMMAAADGHVDESERQAIRRVLRRIPDMDLLDDEELESSVDGAFRRLKGKRLENELMTVAAMLNSQDDRHWAYVYMSVIALADGNNDPSEVEFMKEARRMLRIDENGAARAADTARRFVIE
jgi:uncharacterized tellurite resistance protein B-like protein